MRLERTALQTTGSLKIEWKYKRNELLCGVLLPVVILDDAAQFLSTLHRAFERGCEIDVEDIVADVFASMRSSSVVVFYPNRIDVVKMVQAEAEEIIQTFAF